MQAVENLKSTKMQNMPIVKLILSMSLPAMLSMFVLALYNIVDSIFVAKYHAKALDALSIVFPLQQLTTAFAVGLAVGTNAYVSRKLGQKKNAEATLTAQTGLFIALVSGVVFMILGLTISRPFMKAFTADEETIAFGVTYLRIVMGLSIFVFIEIMCNRVLQATGNMKIPMLCQLVGAIVNIVFDPILIFTFNMGVMGAAIATVFGQFCAMLLALFAFKFSKQDVTVFFDKNFRLKASIVRGIIKIGLPVTIMNAVTAFVTTIMNVIIKAYQSAITILGIFFKLQSFVFMPVFGLTQGILPILSYNYGAKNKQRFMSTYRYSLLFGIAIMLVGTLIFQLLPSQLLAMFNAGGELLTNGIVALRIISISFIAASFAILSSVMVQALRMGTFSMIVSLMRQLFIIIPLALIFSKLWGLNGVWIAYPVAEFLVGIFFLFALRPILHSKFKGFESEPQPIEGAKQNA